MCTSTCMIKLYKATCAWHVVTHSVFWKCWREGCVLLSVDSTQKSTAVLLWPCLASLRLPNVRRKRRPRGFGCERTKALWNCGILGCQLLEHDVKITGAWATRPWPQGGFIVSKQFQNSLPNKKHFTSESYTVDRHCKIHPNVIFLHRYIPVSSHGLTNHLSAASQGDGTWVALQGPFSAIPPAIGGSLASCARQSEPVASTLWPNAVAGAVRSIQNAARTWRPNRHWDECWTKDNYPWPMHRHKPHKRKHLQPKHHSFVAETSQVPCSSAFHDDPWQLPHFLWRPLRSQSAPPDEVIKWKLAVGMNLMDKGEKQTIFTSRIWRFPQTRNAYCRLLIGHFPGFQTWVMLQYVMGHVYHSRNVQWYVGREACAGCVRYILMSYCWTWEWADEQCLLGTFFIELYTSGQISKPSAELSRSVKKKKNLKLALRTAATTEPWQVSGHLRAVAE